MRKFGLIGYPLGHSFSAGYFADKFKRGGINDCRYDNYEIEKIEMLPEVIKNNPELCGLNVTIPYKEQVIRYLDDIHEDAKGIKAVNTIKVDRSNGVKLIGYNTDSFGFESSLLPYLKPYHTKALILGTGGAAKAVAWILTKNKIKYTYVSRVPRIQKAIAYEDVTSKILNKCKLIINSSPLGMHPNTDRCPPIPYNEVTSEFVLYDLIYNPLKTLFLKKGEEQGATVINGLRMLELQADKAWEIWNS